MTRVVWLRLSLALLCACGDSGSLGLTDAATAATPDAASTADAGPSQISFTNQLLDGTLVDAAMVAFQDGDGPWQEVSGTGGIYSFTVSSARYGVLAACTREGLSAVSIYYLATSDGHTPYNVDQCAFPPNVMITITVRNTPAAATVKVDDTEYGTSVFGAGPHELQLFAIAGPGAVIATDLGHMVIVPTTFADGATIDVDFASAFPLAENDLTFDLDDDTYRFITNYFDAPDHPHFIDDTRTGLPVPNRYHAVPADRLGGGISGLAMIGTSGDTSRRISRYFSTPVAQVLSLPPRYQLDERPRVAATLPYPILEATLPNRPGACSFVASYDSGSTEGPERQWMLLYTPAWAGGTAQPSVASRIPDLSGLPGWQEAFALGTGSISWTAFVTTCPAHWAPGADRPVRLQDGDEVTFATQSGTLP